MDEEEKKTGSAVSLPGIKDLFLKSWGVYGRRFWAYASIGILPAALSLMLSSSFPQMNRGNPLLPFYFCLLLAWVIAWLLHVPAWLAVIRYGKGFAYSFRKGTDFFSTYWWTSFLFITVFAGGAVFFALLVGIGTFFPPLAGHPTTTLFVLALLAGGLPAMVSFILFSMFPFIVVSEEQKGFDALYHSFELTKHFFWQLLWRYVVLLLAFVFSVFAPFAAASLIFSWNETIVNAFSFLLVHAIIFPLILIGGSLIYHELEHGREPESAGRARIGKGILFLLSFLGLPIVSALFYMYASNAVILDEGAHNDTDLQLRVLRVPEEKNAFFDLKKAGAILNLSEEETERLAEYASGVSWDDEAARAMLAKNDLTLAFVDSAAQKELFQTPEHIDPSRARLISDIDLTSLSSLARLQILRARLAEKEGDDEEALAIAMRIVRLGYLIEMSRNSETEYAFGGNIREEGLVAIRDLLPSLSVPAETLDLTAKELSSYADTSVGLMRTLNEEYVIKQRGLKELSPDIFERNTANGTPMLIFKDVRSAYQNLSSFHYKPNKTHRLLAESYRNAMLQVRSECGNATFTAPELEPISSSPFYLLLTENSVGKIFLGSAVTRAEKKHAAVCDHILSTAATETLLVLRSYEVTHGSLPSTLADTGKELPRDPFSPNGELLQYDPEARFIYSLGKEHADKGGEPGTLWKDAENPTFSF